MRILHLISSRGFYGAERVVTNLAHELSLSGCQVTLALFNAHTIAPVVRMIRAHAPATHVWSLDSSNTFDLRAITRLARYLRQNGFDFLHTHGYRADMIGCMAARLAGVPQIATCHNWTRSTPYLVRCAQLDCLSLRLATHIVAVSESVRSLLLHSGIDASRISVVPNGIDIQDAPNTTKSSRSTPGICVIARLSPEKGVDVLLRALALLLPEWPELCCTVLGEGPDEPKLRTLAKELGIERALDLRGFDPCARTLLKQSDVVVLPSRTEGLPMVLLEAMAERCPIVATAVGGVPDALGHGTCGLLVPPDNPQALASAIDRLLRDEALQHRLTAAARDAVVTRYSSSAMARQYLAVYANYALSARSLISEEA